MVRCLPALTFHPVVKIFPVFPKPTENNQKAASLLKQPSVIKTFYSFYLFSATLTLIPSLWLENSGAYMLWIVVMPLL